MTVPPPPINPIITIQPLTAVGIPNDSASNNVVLAGARHGDVIEGFVVNRDSNQNPILRTPLGDILVKSDIFLKTGSEIQIRVDVQLASRARIVLIDGQAPEAYVKSSQNTAPRGDVILQSSIVAQARSAAALPSTAPASNLLTQIITLPAVILRQEDVGSKTPASPSAHTAKQTTAPATTQPTPRAAAGAAVQVTILAGNVPSAAPSAGNEAITQLLTPASPAIANTSAAAAPTTSAQPLPQSATPPTANSLAQPSAAPPAQQSAPANPLPPQTTAIPTASAPATQASPAPITPQPAATTPASATSNLTAQDIQTLLLAAAPQRTTPAQLPEALRSPALAAQTLAQDDVPHAPPPAHLPSSYRPFAGAQVQHQPTITAPVTQTSSNTPVVQNTPAAAIAHTAAPIRGEQVQVIGHDPDGATIVKGEQTTLKIFTAKPLPTGTTLTIEITPATTPRPTLGAAIPTRLVEFSSLASHWPALDEALSLVAQTQNIAQGQPALTNLIPNIGPQLTHDLMLFLNVVRSGDIRSFWPPQMLKHIEEVKPDLLGRLQLDMGSMQQLAQPAQPHQWAVYLVPMFFGASPEHMRLFVRHDDGSQTSKDDTHNQRFIMELELSHLGDMQLDGFVQGGARPNQFDLVIRTAKALPTQIEADIRHLFTNALQTTRLKGQILFQVGREHFIAPATQIHADGNSSHDDFTLLA